MNLLDKVVEALEPFACKEDESHVRRTFTGLSHQYEPGRRTCCDAAEALAAVREAQANQEFHSWWKKFWPQYHASQPTGWAVSLQELSREAYLAGQLSGIPAQANPQGFEAWSRGNWPVWNIRNPKATFGQKLRVAYLAGQLSGIPGELRETLLDALGRDASEAASRLAHHHYGPDEEERLEKRMKDAGEARKWLEGPR